MIWLLVPHHLTEVAAVNLLAAYRAKGRNGLVRLPANVVCRGCVGQGLLFWSCSNEHDSAAKVPSVWSSQLVKDIAPKAEVIWSAVEMCLQSAVRHGGRRFKPIEFDRRLSGLTLVDEIGNLQSRKSALRIASLPV
ncbi:hypothetical protein NKH47_31680 [Mesorhizobium sp. M1060]|uniref:hypothetical protein n=1 Tax=unclassified Mesorhizobium TaxID=325217 RepID=UPI0012EC960C|nr:MULTISPECIES: hypothetical protein [unclassified Mesorhizobium]WJI52093.1 hypothetical protein NLY44_05185 [Mesorhizobium sp. C089B]